MLSQGANEIDFVFSRCKRVSFSVKPSERFLSISGSREHIVIVINIRTFKERIWLFSSNSAVNLILICSLFTSK